MPNVNLILAVHTLIQQVYQPAHLHSYTAALALVGLKTLPLYIRTAAGHSQRARLWGATKDAPSTDSLVYKQKLAFVSPTQASKIEFATLQGQQAT